MSEMVERVARAILKANAECIGLKYTDLTKAMARAAIEAMRTPTKAQTAAIALDINAAEVWRAMIDAALSEASR